MCRKVPSLIKQRENGRQRLLHTIFAVFVLLRIAAIACRLIGNTNKQINSKGTGKTGFIHFFFIHISYAN